MMNQVTLEVTLHDDKWPKLTLVVKRQRLAGGPIVSTDSFQYDGAYSQFENHLHNHLRPMIEELIARRKRNL